MVESKSGCEAFTLYVTQVKSHMKAHHGTHWVISSHWKMLQDMGNRRRRRVNKNYEPYHDIRLELTSFIKMKENKAR